MVQEVFHFSALRFICKDSLMTLRLAEASLIILGMRCRPVQESFFASPSGNMIMNTKNMITMLTPPMTTVWIRLNTPVPK